MWPKVGASSPRCMAPMTRTRAPSFLQSLWRSRADETRSLAERVLDPEAKRIVLQIATRCDRLVELITLVEGEGSASGRRGPGRSTQDVLGCVSRPHHPRDPGAQRVA